MNTQNTINITLQAPTDAIASITTINIPITTIDPPTETDITPIHNTTTAWSTPSPQDQSCDGAKLAIFFETLCSYFHGCVDANDIQTLTFCLRHLFYCSARLYQNILPDLTANTRQARDIVITYCIWDQLQAIESLFERIKSLCHLLNCTIPAILVTLENTSRTRGSLIPTTQEVNAQLPEHPATIQDHALAQLNEQLHSWQQSNAQRLIFVDQFADLPTVMPTLEQADTALNILQQHTSAIFGKIIPHFLSLVATDDETAILLLLDLMQKADELQFYMRVQLERLYILLRS
ncbi:MAG TPA: hypothetical protein VGL94_14030 [Ktedonobacteraceae bacterium]|jgi:hypothetical protein